MGAAQNLVFQHAPQSRSAGGVADDVGSLPKLLPAWVRLKILRPDGVGSLLKLLPAWVRLKILRPRADLQEVGPMVSVRF